MKTQVIFMKFQNHVPPMCFASLAKNKMPLLNEESMFYQTQSNYR